MSKRESGMRLIPQVICNEIREKRVERSYKVATNLLLLYAIRISTSASRKEAGENKEHKTRRTIVASIDMESISRVLGLVVAALRIVKLGRDLWIGTRRGAKVNGFFRPLQVRRRGLAFSF